MADNAHFARALALAVALSFAGVAALAPAQEHASKPLQVKPDLPGMATNHRLILKDGSYQIVRKYEIVGDRVRYTSVERGGDWEELPLDLVDWEATRKWERDHANQASEDASPAMKEAEDLDREAAAERDAEKARRPEVATGLELPDQDGVFVLDTFQGKPELVELLPGDLAINAKEKHGLSTLNPLAGTKASLELDGAHAKVHLHVNDPAIYLSLESPEDNQPMTGHGYTVEVGKAKDAINRKHGAHSPQSGFAVVRVDERRAVRVVGAVHVSAAGTVTQNEDVMAARTEIMPGKHWLKLVPEKPLLIGEYALVEILSPTEINQTVWDFRVDPAMGDNPGSIGQILKP